jgi:hypothetical protein
MKLPDIAELAEIVQARDSILAERPDEAITRLKPLITGHERYQTHVALFDAYVASKRYTDAIAQALILQQRRGLAYAELGCYMCQQPMNVSDSTLAAFHAAEAMMRDGRPSEARQQMAGFDRRWLPENLPAYLRERRDAVLSASSRGGM